MSLAEAFGSIFQGHPGAHYVFDPRKGPEYQYITVERGITEEDIARHLRGELPGLLSIPIFPTKSMTTWHADLAPTIVTVFNCHFAAGDCDRHAEEDEPIDYAAVARRITELGLPLVITRSKSPKSAHCWLCFKDADGFSAKIARQLIEKYMKLLGLSVSLEIFPKQDELKPGQVGSGINLPYFSDTRIAFGRDGEELDLAGFIELVRERQGFGKVLASRDLADGTSESGAPGASSEKHGPLPVAAIRAAHAKHLAALRDSNAEGHWNITLNTCAFYAGRAFAAKALEGTERDIKAAIRMAAAARTGHDERVMESTIERSWSDGIAEPLEILNLEKAHADALTWSEWVFNKDSITPRHIVAYDTFALLTKEEFEPLLKAAAKRLGIRNSSLEESVKSRRVTSKARAQTAVSNNLTAEQVKKCLSDLLLTTDKERAALGLPESIEKASQVAEIVLWDYIKENAAIFCTESGLGYILLNDAKDAPIPVTHDGHELSAFLSGLGIHPGAKARNRIGKHFGNQCWREGTRIEPRISFHYDPPTFSAYFAETPGQLIKVTANEITRVPNGTDGQLFLLPRNYEPWRVDLDNLPPGTDIGPDAYALLPEILFDVLEFENESLCRDDVCVLVGAYIITLFLPGIVAGKLLLEIQGGTGSGKTLFARMLGRLIYGRSFEVTGMDSDESQFENALVNNSFLVLDDVKRASNPAILGMIRRAVTGGKSVRRELYSTFGQVSEPYRASIAITSSEEPFSGSDEMSNRELIIFAKQREGYLDEKEMLERIDTNRNALMSEMMVRLQNIIIAVKAQAHFKPVVKMRMASFATFLLRVGRQWDWGVSAEGILDAWKEEQEGSGLDASIVETLELWLAEPELDEGKHYTAGELHRQMVLASQRHNLPVPWWFAKAPALIRALRNGFHAYRRHFGFSFEGRTSGHKPASYWFDPKLRDAEAKKGSGRDAEAEKGVPVRDAEAKKGLPVEQHKIPF